MNEPFREVIKRTVSNRQHSLKQHFLPDKNIRRPSFEMSIQMAKQLKPIIHGSKYERNVFVKKGSRISIHPFSFESHKKQEPEEFKSNQKANAFIYLNYDILDLSYSLISSEINRCTLFTLYIIMLIIRYGSLLCLIYITFLTESKNWEWVFCIIITYVIYFISMIKVSLRPAENKCQTILKLVFDSLEINQAVDYFQVIDVKKLMQSIFRALVPPQFSFLFIVASSQMKRIEIYSMVNYIYSSIEAIIYYPFFVIYTSIYFDSTLGEMPQAAYLTVMGSIMLAESIFVILTAYLILYGCKRRGYGRPHPKK